MVLRGESSGTLSESDQWAYRGSLNWWINQQVTTYQPISDFLNIAGIVTMVILLALSSVI